MVQDPEQAKQVLIERREELERISALSAESRETVVLDQSSVGRLSRIDSLQQQAMAQATERQRTSELSRIESALRRIDEGEYGYCVECGEEIAEKRLFHRSVGKPLHQVRKIGVKARRHRPGWPCRRGRPA